MALIEAPNRLIIVADDAGFHHAINRGITEVARSGALSHADFMMGGEFPTDFLLSFQGEFPHVGLGLHVYIPGMEDNSRNTIVSNLFRFHPSKEMRASLVEAAETQIKCFQDATGSNPSHVSTHNHLNLSQGDKPFDWFTDALNNLLDGKLDQVLIRGVHTKPIRHTRFRQRLLGKKPMTPDQFKRFLHEIRDPETLFELVVHPAISQEGEEMIPAAYSTLLREQDLTALMDIINSGVIEESGFVLGRNGVFFGKEVD